MQNAEFRMQILNAPRDRVRGVEPFTRVVGTGDCLHSEL
jgi:hypothetical protein